MRRRRDAGFTLLELLIALSLVSLLLTLAFGGLRVALAAWRQGDDRADAHQHVRGVAVTLARGLSASYAYKATLTQSPEPVLLFNGTAKRVEFVTEAAPFPLGAPIAFTAVVISLEDGEQGGLVVRERALPNRDPFSEATIVYRDAAVTTLELRYMDDGGAWKEEWDGQNDRAIPRAVKISVGAAGPAHALPPITVTLRSAPPS